MNGSLILHHGCWCPGDPKTHATSSHDIVLLFITSSPFYWHGLTLIPTGISNHIHHNMWDEIIYPFLNFNGCSVEVGEWMINFIPHFTRLVITYPCWDKSSSMLIKWATERWCDFVCGYTTGIYADMKCYQVTQNINSSHWRHNERDGVSNHRRLDC